MINIYKDGTKVFITDLKQTGTIVGAIIRQGKVTYEVSYFANAEHRIINLNKYEFDPARTETEKIGFYVEKSK